MHPTHFFIIGAQRSGTTYLYHLLDKHPNISMAKPMRPEPKFFIHPPKETDIQNYLNTYHLIQETPIQAFGEKSTSYYEKPEVADNIYRYFPDAKIIMMLRNPIERAISNYFFTLQHGLETRTLKEVFIQKLPSPTKPQHISVSPFDYLERGNYSQYLPAYIHKFGINNIKILLFENFTNNTQHLLSDVFNFLEINQYEVEIDGSKNESQKIQQIPAEVCQTLANYYSNEIEKLEEMIDVNLNIWEI